MRSPITVSLLFAVSLVAVGCPPPKTSGTTPVASVSDNPAAEKLFKLGRGLFEEGRYEEADVRLEQFLKLHPGDPLAPAATVYRARVSMQAGDMERAVYMLAGLTFSSSDDPVARQAGLYMSRALFELARYDEALGRITTLIGKLTATEDRAMLLDLAWRSANKVGDMAHSVGWLDAYLRICADEEKRKAAVDDLERLVSSIDDLSLLEELVDNLSSDGVAWAMVLRRLAWKRYESGDYEGAVGALKIMDDADVPRSKSIMELGTLLRKRTSVDLGAVGCILPMSGRSRLVGEAVLRGIMMGTRKVKVGRNDGPVSIVIRDSEGDPVKAARAVEELVDQENVAAIIGPVDGRAAASAARVAQDLSIPIVVLSVDEEIEKTGDFVFGDFITNAGQVRSLVDAAVRLEGGSFAAMYPEDGYGRMMVKELDRELARRGLGSAVRVGYSPDQKSFSTQARALAGKEFDALFLPDTAARLALIAPALAVEGIWSADSEEGSGGSGARRVRFLVPSTGISPDLPRRAGRYLQGAVFASGYYPTGTAASEEFARRFEVEYGSKPTHYSAFGHDAVVLVASAIRSGAMGRYDIAATLARTGYDDLGQGLVAPFGGFDENGANKTPAMVIILVGDDFEVLP